LENIVALQNLDIFETGFPEHLQKICLRQTTGNSPGPQGNDIQRFLWHFF
jgi:hypothetical protein